MQDNLRMMWEMLRHGPAAVLGFVSIGVSGVFLVPIRFKMREVGGRLQNLSRPRLIAGIVLLVFGLARLPD